MTTGTRHAFLSELVGSEISVQCLTALFVTKININHLKENKIIVHVHMSVPLIH